MIAHLFHAPIGEDEAAVGVGTVGSSEAIMLAGLAFKRKWQIQRKSQGKPYDKPNIVTGANVQVGLQFLFFFRVAAFSLPCFQVTRIKSILETGLLGEICEVL